MVWEPAANAAEATTGLDLAWTFHEEPARESEAQGFVESLQRWRTDIARITGSTECETYWARKAILAAADLIGNVIEAPGYGNMDGIRVMGGTTLTHLSSSYWWDAMTTVPAMERFEAGVSGEFIEALTRFLDTQDFPPYAINAFPTMQGVEREWGSFYPPIGGWAAVKSMHCDGNTAIAERVYPSLRTLPDRWFRYGDCNRDGIPEWVNSGATADDSPLYDAYASGTGSTGPTHTCRRSPASASARIC